jgi:membrane-associated phospholipid phosphatase
MNPRLDARVSPRLLGAATVGFLIFGGLGVAARSNALGGADRAVRRRIHPKRSKPLTKVAHAVSSLAAPHVHPVLAALLAFTVGRIRGRGAPSVILASLSVTALDKASRISVHQKRPGGAPKHEGLDRFAYPSGHTCAMTAIGVAAASEISEIASPELETIIWGSVIFAAAAVGWSRLYLDEHWIDDVAGGWGAGAAVGVGAVVLADKLSSFASFRR